MSCARALSAELKISTQRNQIRLRQIMNRKLSTKRSPAQVTALHMRCPSGLWRRRPAMIGCEILFLAVLDEFDLVAFRRVNEGNSTAVRRMWSVRKRMAFCRSVLGKLIQIVDLKSEVRQIGTDDNRAAPVELAYLNFLIAPWCFQEDEL